MWTGNEKGTSEMNRPGKVRYPGRVDPVVEEHLNRFISGLGGVRLDTHQMRQTLHEVYEDHMPEDTDAWSAFVAGATYVTASMTFPGAFSHRVVRYLFCTTLGTLLGLIIPSLT